MRRLALLFLTISALLAGPTSAHTVRGETPTEAVRQHVARMHSIFTDGRLTTAARDAATRETITRTFDFSETARRALGPHRARMTAPERSAFVTGIATRLSEVYVTLVEQFYSHREEALGARFQYTDEMVSGNEARVELRMLRPNEQLPLEAFLHRQGQRWRIYDVAVHGVRLTENYRAQVDRLSRSGEYGHVLNRVERRPPRP